MIWIWKIKNLVMGKTWTIKQSNQKKSKEKTYEDDLKNLEDSLLESGFQKSSGWKHLFNLVYLSLSFCGIFAAWNAVQNLISSIVPGLLGYWSIAALYASFCFGSLLVAPALTKILQSRVSMVLGSLTYVGFMVANLKPLWETLIPTAVLLGIGASILWAAQGAYLTAAASNYAGSRGDELKSAMGLFNGLFFAIFQCSGIIGNLLGSFILSGAKGNSQTFLFYIFIAIAGSGSLALCFIRPEVNLHEQKKEDSSVSSRILQAIYLMKDRRMIFIIPVLFYSGLEQGFIFGDFTKNCIKDPLGAEWIGFIMAVFAAVDAVSSYTFGKLSDTFGKRPMILIGFLTHIAFHSFWVFFLQYKSFSDIADYRYILFISAAVYGIGDAVWNTFPSIMMSFFWTEQAEAAFSVLKLFNSLGFTAAFIWGPLLTFFQKEMIAVSVLVVAVSGIFILDRFIASLDGKVTGAYQPINVTKDA